jgi:hypothetical protein
MLAKPAQGFRRRACRRQTVRGNDLEGVVFEYEIME